MRVKALNLLKEKLKPLALLDEFKVAGVFANWWEELIYDFKTILSEGEINELLEEIEDWEEEEQGEKTLSKTLKYLKKLVDDLKKSGRDIALK